MAHYGPFVFIKFTVTLITSCPTIFGSDFMPNYNNRGKFNKSRNLLFKKKSNNSSHDHSSIGGVNALLYAEVGV